MASLHDQQFSFSSEDEPINEDGSSKQAGVKRGTRACDRCRKIKSKCEPGTEERCKNCEIANTPCTFQGPSFKRGPPKGYINSIEQRWHQVECILATIMESPRAQDIISDLRSDSIASTILDRVQSGPYGTLQKRQDPTSESFYSSLMEVPEHSSARDDRRSRRQSRVSREIVSQDPTASATPTREWQEQLTRRLNQRIQLAYASSSMSPASRSSSVSVSTNYPRTRRRLDWPPTPQNNWDDLYTLPDPQNPAHDSSNMDETAEAFGHLSVDQNEEIRYHGPASGLPLLAQSHRNVADDQQENRIWKFAANVDPQDASYGVISEEEDLEVRIPAPETQNFLLQLYFTYVHPAYPVIHKQDFLYHYNILKTHSALSSAQKRAFVGRHPIQQPSKMLLLSMFAIAARYSNRSEDRHAHAGQEYAEDAHKLLDGKYQSSRPSTCQALLLLAVREFGMGAMDKGWLYSGMAMRMAVDLGMNRNADHWTTDGKQAIFTDIEKQIRKHIWWSCCISDKLSAVWLGRPITFRANDYSTSMPDEDEVDETEMWQPYPPGVLGDFAPQPARLMTSFREACHLSIIITDIMDKIYPVQLLSDTPRRALFEQLEMRLTKWLIELPEHLCYSNDKRAIILPHVLMLHIEYQAAVLLLHRAFLPPYNQTSPHLTMHLQSDPLALKAFDVCSSAAGQISSMAEIFNDKFGLERAPPFLCIFLQSAGIMHVVTLTRRPSDPQATLGLARCIKACKQVEKLWPIATRLRTMLEGAQVHLDESTYTSETDRHKRSIEDALGKSKNPDYAARDLYELPIMDGYPTTSGPDTNSAWNSAQNAHMVAHTLGVSGSGTEASTSSYPGYQWWPNQLMTADGLTAHTEPMEVPAVSASVPYTSLPVFTHPQATSTHHQQSPVQEPFTFGQTNLSTDFTQRANYPGFQFNHYQHPRHLRPRQ